MKRGLAVLLALALLLSLALPVQAAENAGKAVEVRVKVGSGQMTVNKEKIGIQAPYNAGKIAMAPLSVFTNAKGFGATLKPTGKSLKLAYLKHTLVLTKGSKAATFDGKKTTLPAAPVDKSGVTMVPLEAIAKALGLKLSTDAKTKEFVLKGTSASPAATGNSIDSDAGKNKVGDSYYQWSMNLPTNLAQTDQYDKGSRIAFADVKGEFYMAVFVDEEEEPLDESEQIERLKAGRYGKTIVDESTVARGKDTFQRVVMKDATGFFYEYRGIQRNGFFYTVVFGKKAKTKAELDAYRPLLDSFQTSFDSSNKSLKDLSIVKNGKIAYKNATYGLGLMLPVSWDEDVYSSYRGDAGVSYVGPEDETLEFAVHSVLPNDKLDAWVQRDIRYMEDMVAEQYRKPVEKTSVTWNGIPAILLRSSFSADAKTWTDEVSIYAMKGDYKYQAILSYPQERKNDVSVVLDEMLRGLKIDFAVVEKNFGRVPDEDDARDLTALATKTSKDYGYSVTVPKYWIDSTVDMEDIEVEFGNDGVHLLIAVEEDSSLSEVQDTVEKMYATIKQLKLDSKTDVTFAGVPAVLLRFTTKESSEVQAKFDIYLFEKNGNAYMVQAGMLAAFATPLNTKQLQDALNSFTFTS